MKKNYPKPQIPLILRFHRLMDAFAKSDDERDFYLDKIEGFLVYVDLDKSEEEIEALEKEFAENRGRYALIPKMTFFEVKKFMEGFVQEKVYDIDTKEKLMDIIGAKEARENFLEFIYEQLTELEKWQAFFQERSRIRIIEWLRSLELQFVFEEDLDLQLNVVEKLKKTLFEEKVSKDVAQARQVIFAKSKTYYSNEALNPRPKRGRPPKQVAKVQTEPQFTVDIYMTVPPSVRSFLYIPDITSASSVTFSSRFDKEENLLASLRGTTKVKVDERLEALSERLESLQKLSHRLSNMEASLGLEQLVKPFEPASKSKMKLKEFSVSKDEEKIGKALHEVFPSKKEKKGLSLEEGEYLPQKRKKFGIKQVAPIKHKKKKQ